MAGRWEASEESGPLSLHGDLFRPKWKAPFTQEQVTALRKYQANPLAHPYTCAQHGTRLLVSWDGLECPEHGCWYHQTWSHQHAADREAEGGAAPASD